MEEEINELELLDRKEYQKISAELEPEEPIRKDILSVTLEDSEARKLLFQEAYEIIYSLLKKYTDLRDEYYPFLAVWILGTYFHQDFLTYPYVFLNAIKAGGKSRTLRLIMSLSNHGEVQNSMTEAVLFRQNNPIGIDEFEGIGRKGIENFRELLNSAYKKGTKVKRAKKQKSLMGGEEIVIEEFNVFRPIAMANIWGMEDVTGDRCINLVLEKSGDENITNLIEIWEEEYSFKKLKKIMEYLQKIKFSEGWCSEGAPGNVYLAWNNQLPTLTHTTTLPTLTYTNLHQIFQKIKESRISGRHLELFFPLFIISSVLPDKRIFRDLINFGKEYVETKKEDEYIENKDILVFQFVAGQIDTDKFERIASILERFRQETQINDEWLSSAWIGRTFKRLNLIKKRKRIGKTGVEVILNIPKAQEKLKIFEPEENSKETP